MDEVIGRANRLPYGLASFVFTRDLARADEATSRLQAGMVGINSLYIAQAETPFGGVKDSGDGRESGLEGLERLPGIQVRLAELSLTRLSIPLLGAVRTRNEAEFVI